MRLWSLAGRVYNEAIFQGQVTAAGSNTARLTEKLKSNSGYVAKQGRTIQILGSFYLLTVASLSVISFIGLRSAAPSAWNLLVASGSVSMQLIVQSGYLIMLTIIATAEILAPDLYRWPASLPLSKSELGALKLLSLAREFMLPLGVIVVATPAVVGFAGGSLPGAVVGLVVSVIHAALTLGLLVIFSWKMRRVLRSSDTEDRGARFTRVFTMVVYGFGTLLIVFIMQLGSNTLAGLFDAPRLSADASLVALRVMSVVPLPTAPALLLTLLSPAAAGAAGSAAVPLWLPSVGTALYALLAAIIVARALTIVRGDGTEARAARPVAVDSTRPSTAVFNRRPAPIVVRTPRAAFTRQIGRAMTRDTQVLITLIFPTILPILSSIGPLVSGADRGIAITMSVIIAGTAGSWMIIHGLTRLQFGGGALEATLPVRERDRVFPRLILASILPASGALLVSLFFLPLGSAQQLGALAQALAVAVIAPAGMLVKMALFGRMTSGSAKVVVDEVRPEVGFWKWTAVVGLLVGLTAAAILGQRALVAGFGGMGKAIFLVGASRSIFSLGSPRVTRPGGGLDP